MTFGFGVIAAANGVRCGFSGGGWTGNYAAHFNRCLAAPQSARDQETAAGKTSSMAASRPNRHTRTGTQVLLDDVYAEIVRLRCSGSPWKPICWRLGIGRATAHRRWTASLLTIVGHLVASAAVAGPDLSSR